jgi:hypothetical protein
MTKMSEQSIPSAVAQRIIVKFVTNENVNPADILTRLNAHFGDETLSRTQMYDWSKSLKESRTEPNRRLLILQGKLRPAFWGGGGTLKASYSSIF